MHIPALSMELARRTYVTTLAELLRQQAAAHPDRRAYVFLDAEAEPQSLTYGDLDRMARAVAVQLLHAGLAGTRALVVYPSGLDFVVGFFGCLYAGVVAVPVAPPEHRSVEPARKRLAAIANDACPGAVLGTSATLSLLAGLNSHSPSLRAAKWLPTDAPGADPDQSELPFPPQNAGSLAYLQYTSGSTGTPRGVMISHANVLAYCAQQARRINATSETVWVGWLPLQHDFGLLGSVLRPLFSAYLSVLMPPQAFVERPIRWLRAISCYGGTLSAGPNFAFDLCVRRTSADERAGLDLSTWAIAQNGAEPVREATLRRFSEAFAPYGFRPEALSTGYGLAEATLGVATSDPGVPAGTMAADRTALGEGRVVEREHDAPGARRLVSCGRPYQEQRVEIVDPESGRRLGEGMVGEIWVSGANVALGYWARPEESERTFQARLADSGDGPFLRTGDLGFLHHGELFVTGRIKDMLIVRGRNLYAEDLEASVEASDPGVRTGGVAAFAASAEDDRLIVVAETRLATDAEQQQLLGSIRRAVVREHGLRPAAILLVRQGSLPRTSSGKLQRYACRAAFLNGELPTVAAWQPGGRSSPTQAIP